MSGKEKRRGKIAGNPYMRSLLPLSQWIMAEGSWLAEKKLGVIERVNSPLCHIRGYSDIVHVATLVVYCRHI